MKVSAAAVAAVLIAAPLTTAASASPPPGPGDDLASAAAEVHAAASAADGYWLLEQDGTIHNFGLAAPLARTGGTPPGAGAQVVDLESNWAGTGAYVLASDGRVALYGTASTSPVPAATVAAGDAAVAILPHPSGEGAWIVTRRGHVVGSGLATALGDLADLALTSPIVDAVSTPDGLGYWLVGADGGVFAFGEAPFLGSMGGVRLAQPVVAIAPTVTGEGYTLVAADGGVFAFGDAAFVGSMGGVRINRPVVEVNRTAAGYRLVAADGGVFNFGDANHYGSLADRAPDTPVVDGGSIPDTVLTAAVRLAYEAETAGFTPEDFLGLLDEGETLAEELAPLLPLLVAVDALAALEQGATPDILRQQADQAVTDGEITARDREILGWGIDAAVELRDVFGLTSTALLPTT